MAGMWVWVQRHKWTGMGSTVAAGLGVWADKDSVIDSANIVPFIAWAFPYFCLWVAIMLGTAMAFDVVVWIIDRFITEGPAKREFHALSGRIQQCRWFIAGHLAHPEKEPIYQTMRTYSINTDVAMILGDLERLGVPIPPFKGIHDPDSVGFVTSYFIPMQRLAYAGRLKEARRQRIPSDWVFEEPDNG